ncbi:uncharacterized protein [Arachis hypogaea]|uniref:uncharacterized protein isoform X1 n=1 Tax=Arachis hypogaea TaxID=3818 RepID=UPI003B20B606
MEGAGTHTLKKFLIFLISSILTWLKHYAKSVPWKHSGWIQRNGEEIPAEGTSSTGHVVNGVPAPSNYHSIRTNSANGNWIKRVRFHRQKN